MCRLSKNNTLLVVSLVLVQVNLRKIVSVLSHYVNPIYMKHHKAISTLYF